MALLIYYISTDDAEVVNRAVVFVGLGQLNLVYGLQPLNDFAKDGVLPVEVGLPPTSQ